MSGICAAWYKGDPGRAVRSVAAISSGLALSPLEQASKEAGNGAALGISARFTSQQIYRNRRLLVCCDAELYNEDELQRSVGKRDPLAGGSGTAALIAALYERHGGRSIEKLRGAFAIVIWDERERAMFAAVDRFGIKRLVYYEDSGVLLLSSRGDALARTGDFAPEINPCAIANLLNFTANLAPETIFTRVRRLPPGSTLTAAGAHCRIERYWDMRYGAEDHSGEKRLSRELQLLVERSVADHCKSDPSHELGAFLSGGTDSSTVLGMMTRARGPVKAFSIGFQEQRFNELDYARIAAKRFGADHHTYLVGPRDCFGILPEMIRYFDEPFGNSSAIPTYFCARLAAQNGVKSLLAGDGGDELFGGNERYATDKVFEIYHRAPGFLRKGILEPFLNVLPIQNGLVGKARRYIARANQPGIARMLSFQFLRTHAPEEVFDPDFLDALGGYTVLDIPSRHYAGAAARDHLDRLLYVDLKITLADNDLPKVTFMSELAGIQARFPFLDRSVAEFSGRIPARWKVNGFEKRYLFKRAFRNLLPAEIIAKKKHGFGIPVSIWLKTDERMRELAHDALLSARAFSRGYFRRDFIEKLFRDYQTDGSGYYGDTIWTLLMLELWHCYVADASMKVTA